MPRLLFTVCRQHTKFIRRDRTHRCVDRYRPTAFPNRAFSRVSELINPRLITSGAIFIGRVPSVPRTNGPSPTALPSVRSNTFKHPRFETSSDYSLILSPSLLARSLDYVSRIRPQRETDSEKERRWNSISRLKRGISVIDIRSRAQTSRESLMEKSKFIRRRSKFKAHDATTYSPRTFIREERDESGGSMTTREMNIRESCSCTTLPRNVASAALCHPQPPVFLARVLLPVSSRAKPSHPYFLSTFESFSTRLTQFSNFSRVQPKRTRTQREIVRLSDSSVSLLALCPASMYEVISTF